MGELGDLAYWPDDAPHISDNRLVSMYHSGTPEYNKAVALQKRAPPALHIKSYIIVFNYVFIV